MDYIQKKYIKYKDKYLQLKNQIGSGRVVFKKTKTGNNDEKTIKIYDVPKSWSTQEVVWLLKHKLPPNIGNIVNASKILDSYLGGNVERFIFIDFLNEQNGREAFRILQELDDIFDTTGMDTSFRNNTAFFKGKQLLYKIDKTDTINFPTLGKPGSEKEVPVPTVLVPVPVTQLSKLPSRESSSDKIPSYLMGDNFIEINNLTRNLEPHQIAGILIEIIKGEKFKTEHTELYQITKIRINYHFNNYRIEFSNKSTMEYIFRILDNYKTWILDGNFEIIDKLYEEKKYLPGVPIEIIDQKGLIHTFNQYNWPGIKTFVKSPVKSAVKNPVKSWAAIIKQSNTVASSASNTRPSSASNIGPSTSSNTRPSSASNIGPSTTSNTVASSVSNTGPSTASNTVASSASNTGLPMKKPECEIDSENPFLLNCKLYKDYNNYKINLLLKKILGTIEFIFDKQINSDKIIRFTNKSFKGKGTQFRLIFRNPERTIEAKRLLESADISAWSDGYGSKETDNLEGFNLTNFKDEEKLFQISVPVGEEYPEMINYHYVWFKFNNERTGFEHIPETTYKRILEEIINRFTYPSCNIYSEFMTSAERTAIVNDEYALVKAKFASLFPEIEVIKVPLISYQLVAYEYMQTLDPSNFSRDLKYEKGGIRIIYPEITVGVDAHCEFKEKLKILSSQIWQNAIFEINELFVTYIEMNMFPDIIAKTNPFNLHLLIFEKILVSLQKRGGKIVLIADSVTDPRFTIMLTQTLYIECGFIYNFENKSYTSNRNKSLLLLYRGNEKWDDVVLRRSEGRVHSNSYNTSILNGIYHETIGRIGGKGACTYEFFDPGYLKKYYTINKFVHGDGTIEDNLFIIPPIHPFLLLFGKGEKFHARSKMPKNWSSFYDDVKGLRTYSKSHYSGIFLGPNENMPKYLLSDYNYNDFNTEFQKIIANSRNTFLHYLFKKYLKYKLKYLKLKNRIE